MEKSIKMVDKRWLPLGNQDVTVVPYDVITQVLTLYPLIDVRNTTTHQTFG